MTEAQIEPATTTSSSKKATRRPSKLKSLLGKWEQRASSNGQPDIAKIASGRNVYVSPPLQPKKKVMASDNGRKSTRQTIEDLSLFASPRIVHSKFTVSSKKRTSKDKSSLSTLDLNSSSDDEEEETKVHDSPVREGSSKYPAPSSSPSSVLDRHKPQEPPFSNNNDNDESGQETKIQDSPITTSNKSGKTTNYTRSSSPSVLDRYKPHQAAPPKEPINMPRRNSKGNLVLDRYKPHSPQEATAPPTTTPRRNSKGNLVLDRYKPHSPQEATSPPPTTTATTTTTPRRNSKGNLLDRYKPHESSVSQQEQETLPEPTAYIPRRNSKSNLIANRAKAFQNNNTTPLDTIPPSREKAFRPHGKRSSVLNRFNPSPAPSITTKSSETASTNSSAPSKSSTTKSKTTTTSVSKPADLDSKSSSHSSASSSSSSSASISDGSSSSSSASISTFDGEDDIAQRSQPPPSENAWSDYETTTNSTINNKTTEPVVVDDDIMPTPGTKQPSKQAQEKAKLAKINRNQIVLQEIRQIIKKAEDVELDGEEMDEEIVECLEKAAVKSAAYTRHWYDAVSDTFLHIPTLAGCIMDFTLLELAQQLYQKMCEEEDGEEYSDGEIELPLLYTVSLRSIAADIAQDEEEVPEYVLKLAE